jgi:hypothetical protein
MHPTDYHPLPRGRTVRLMGLTLLLFALAGCGGRYTPVPVSGVVTLDGEPIAGATVFFYVTGDSKDGRLATGTTDKEGKFRLSTLGKNDGALPRPYKVVIHKYVPTKPNLKIPEFPKTPEGRAQREDFMYENFQAQGIQPFKNSLPTQYADSKSTPLECNVTGSTTVKFDLVSKK